MSNLPTTHSFVVKGVYPGLEEAVNNTERGRVQKIRKTGQRLHEPLIRAKDEFEWTVEIEAGSRSEARKILAAAIDLSRVRIIA